MRFFLAFAAILIVVSIAGAAPQPGGSTQTTITVAGLVCDTNYRIRINPVGVSGQATTMRIRTQPCDEPPPPPPPPSGTTKILQPADGATLSGIVTVRWQAATGADWGAIYSCGGNLALEDLATDAQSVFEVQWDTQDPTVPECTNGQHGLAAWSFDNDIGPIGDPDEISITLDNAPLPPPPPPSECNATSAPGPISGQGYTQRFGDCFDTLDRTVWCSHEWWEPSPVVGSQTVTNGELRLRRSRTSGYANTTMSTGRCGQANEKRFKFGYFEARMKFETVQGNGPAFWMVSSRHQYHAMGCTWTQATADVCPTGGSTWDPNNRNAVCAELGEPVAQCLGSELDVFEGYGRIFYGGTRTDDWISGTLHRNTSEFYGEPNTTRGVSRGTGADLSQYHVYSARWTPTQVCYFFDGVQYGCVNTFDSTAQPMYLLLYNWNTVWESENMPDGSTEPELDVWVDWVRVWQQ